MVENWWRNENVIRYERYIFNLMMPAKKVRNLMKVAYQKFMEKEDELAARLWKICEGCTICKKYKITLSEHVKWPSRSMLIE